MRVSSMVDSLDGYGPGRQAYVLGQKMSTTRAVLLLCRD